MTIRAFNLETRPVDAQMTAWGVEPGRWRVTRDHRDTGRLLGGASHDSREVALERTTTLDVRFPPRTSSLVTLELVSAGTPYWSRPDLGIDPQDVTVTGQRVSVVVHPASARCQPSTIVAVLTGAGRTVASAPVPLLALRPTCARATTVTFSLPPGIDMSRCTVVIDPSAR